MRPNRLTNLAKERGVTEQELLTDLYEKHGSQRQVANELNMSQSRVSQLIKIHGLIEKTILVKDVVA